MSLYLTEPEVAREVLGTKRISEWRGIAAILERDGFPKIDPLFGGRYMPAVRAWLDAYNGTDSIQPRQQWREEWPETKRRGSSGERAKADNVSPIGSRGQT